MLGSLGAVAAAFSASRLVRGGDAREVVFDETLVLPLLERGAGEVAPLMLVGVVKLAPSLPVDGNYPYLHLADGAFADNLGARTGTGTDRRIGLRDKHDSPRTGGHRQIYAGFAVRCANGEEG